MSLSGITEKSRQYIPPPPVPQQSLVASSTREQCEPTEGKRSLYVVFYRPLFGNYQHWALYLETDTEQVIFEVTGSHPLFERNVVEADPRRSRRFTRMIFLDTIGPADIATVRYVASNTDIDNETLEWDCQDYVLEMLDRLEEEYVLDLDDETYKDAKDEVKERRGAIV